MLLVTNEIISLHIDRNMSVQAYYFICNQKRSTGLISKREISASRYFKIYF